jgi:Domain of unknown function (DUF4168)
MAKRDRSNLLKNLLVMGAAGAGLLVSFPALAQSDEPGASETTAPEEFQLSAEGFKILCENFPLNSRCQGGSGEQPSAVPETTPRESLNPGTSEPSMPAAPSLSPAPETPEDTTSPSYEPPTTEPSGGLTPEKPGDSMSPAPSGGVEVPQPSLPSTPDSPKPQSLDVPGAVPKGERSETTQAPSAPSAAPREAPNTTPQSTPAEPTAPAPGSAPGAAPSSGTPAAPVAEVSEAELQQFAKVIPELQEIQQSAQQQVSEAIQSAGLTEDRFRELYTAQQSPSGGQQPAATAATPQEQQAVQQVVTQLETIKKDIQTRREAAVRSQGLEVNRFNEILAAVRQDSELQQQLQQILNN